MFSEEGSIMTDQELLDMFIQERINMIIDVFHKNQPDKSEQEEERILQAEIFIESLPGKEKQLVENYIDSLISQLVLEEAFLHRHGLTDVLKFFKYIVKS
jgi:Uma2 family endonuclease